MRSPGHFVLPRFAKRTIATGPRFKTDLEHSTSRCKTSQPLNESSFRLCNGYAELWSFCPRKSRVYIRLPKTSIWVMADNLSIPVFSVFTCTTSFNYPLLYVALLHIAKPKTLPSIPYSTCLLLFYIRYSRGVGASLTHYISATECYTAIHYLFLSNTVRCSDFRC